MKEVFYTVLARVTPVLLIVIVVAAVVGIAIRQNDDYCRSIPMERMDKERCGL